MIDIIRHYIPDIIQRRSKFVFTSKWCPFCLYKSPSNIFRVNLKLKVFKCYNCGRSGKDTNKFKHYIKIQKKNGYRVSQRRFKGINDKKLTVITFEVYYGCETYEESLLPF